MKTSNIRDLRAEIVNNIATNIALEELVQLGVVTLCAGGVYRLTELIDAEDNEYLINQWNTKGVKNYNGN